MLEIEQYMEHETSLSTMREEMAMIEKEQRATKYAEVGRWVSGNLSDKYTQSWKDSLSRGQQDSKLWMVEKIAELASRFEYTHPTHIEIIGSWFSWPLIEYLDYSFPNIKQIDCYDKDELCHPVMAQYKNKFKPDYPVHQFGDWFSRSDVRRREVIINTSGEHMPHISQRKAFFKDNPLVVIMSNDYYDGEGHTHCVENFMKLKEQQQLGQVYYVGQKLIGTGPVPYNRFMVIGRFHATSTHD
tara:strand:- start:735 stop:1463 length:729 start_codon:yes stop_codon:yes gene_type:complete